jgi:predicted nucleotidyltransferase
VATDIGTRKVTLAELRARAGELATIGARHGVGNLRVFGSVARAEADEDSDVDLLVDLEPGYGLIALGSFIAEVEEALGVRVDVATVGGLRPRLRERVLAEAIGL